MSHVIYIPKPKPLITTINFGALYNWYAAINPQTISNGYLYNWYAATNSNNLANSSWHVPTIYEYQTLANYLGAGNDYMTNTIGGKLKESGYTHWNSPNTGADNSSLFNAKGSGGRDYSGSFSGLLTGIQFQTTSTFFSSMCAASLAYNSNTFTCRDNVGYSKTAGGSIRLIKTTTSLTNGQTGTYTGNDGRVYNTICIGTQEWLSENLAETRYRNGDEIPEVTNNSTWSGLTTGARCSYNNIDSNVGSGYAITSSDAWMIPINTVLSAISTYLGATAGGKLKETGFVYWDSPNTGATNEVGFNGRGAGYRDGGSGSFLGLKTNLRVLGIRSTEGYFMNINNSSDTDGAFGWSGTTYKRQGVSFRVYRNCTTEELSLPDGAVSITYTGNDGKVYRCCKIGNYIITADNLAETKFRNGDWISGFDNGTYTPISNATWSGLTTGAMCFYNDVINNG